MLCSSDCYLITDVSGQPIGPIFKNRSIIRYVTLNTGPIICPETSVTKYQSSPRNVAEERGSQISRTLWLYHVHERHHNVPPLHAMTPVLSHTNLVGPRPSHHFNILPSILRSPEVVSFLQVWPIKIT